MQKATAPQHREDRRQPYWQNQPRLDDREELGTPKDLGLEDYTPPTLTADDLPGTTSPERERVTPWAGESLSSSA
jgi:hypothetical protein